MKNWLIGKDPEAGKDWRQEEKGTTEDEMAGGHHGLNGLEFEWTLGVGDGQGSLVCRSHGVTKSWPWLGHWTELRSNEWNMEEIGQEPRSSDIRVHDLLGDGLDLLQRPYRLLSTLKESMMPVGYSWSTVVFTQLTNQASHFSLSYMIFHLGSKQLEIFVNMDGQD